MRLRLTSVESSTGDLAVSVRTSERRRIIPVIVIIAVRVVVVHAIIVLIIIIMTTNVTVTVTMIDSRVVISTLTTLPWSL